MTRKEGILENKPRTVIPRWRLFNKTTDLDQQLSSSRRIRGGTDAAGERSLEEYEKDVRDFRRHQSIWFAGDLLADALAMGDHAIAGEVGDFILAPNSGASPTLQRMAGQYAQDIPVCNVSEDLRKTVSNIRKRLVIYPWTAPGWCDLAFYLTLAGKHDAATRAFKVAVGLAPANRFVLRAAARFYIHSGEADRAHNLLFKSEATQYDPWLLAGEIAAATAIGRRSRLITLGRRLVKDMSFERRHVSELASAIGTVMIEAETPRREIRTMFHASLESPTENSFAQAEWASRQVAAVPSPNFRDRRDVYEGRTWQHYVVGDYEGTLKHAEDWFRDQPFSARPAQLISWIRSALLEEHEYAIDILRRAVKPNPTDSPILNNLAFAYANRDKEGDLLSARRYADRARRAAVTEEERIFATATRGLIAFREGRADEGRHLYLEAIEATQNPAVDTRIAAMAWAYLAREESLQQTACAPAAVLNARTLASKVKSPDVRTILEHLEPTFCGEPSANRRPVLTKC